MKLSTIYNSTHHNQLEFILDIKGNATLKLNEYDFAH